jgi:glucose/arabinose dehydrogenase
MKRYATLFWSIGLYTISMVGWSQTPQLRLQTFATGLTKPVDVVSAGTNRLFVAEIGGKIKIIESTGAVLSTPFLQIPADRLIDVEYNGIYSIAFHPNFANNGYFYVFYNRKDGQSNLSRFTRNASNPNVADLSSELVIMTLPFPDKGHRGGTILFGPDSYLYIFVGDDGNVGRGQMGDVLGNAQNLQKRYGKILRIDVNSGSPYSIPPTNPYLTPGDGIPDEIWARGLRNPWRCSFDRETGDLWLGDNGQDGYEEVDFVAANASKIVPAAQNFGWRCYEGANPYAAADCNPGQSLVMPLHEYAGFSNNGNQSASVVGGYVYRGSAHPSLRGWYVYGDYAQGKLWLLRREANNTYQNVVQSPTLVNPVGFGEGSDGELYVLTFNEGTLYRITTTESPVVTNRPPVAPSPPVLAATVGQAFTTTLPVFTDSDSNPLTYALTSLPTGLTFNAGSRLIRGTPTQSGTFSLVYSATDGFLKTDLSIPLTVAAAGTVVSGNFEGYLDVVNCGTLSGWVWNRDKPNTHIPVEFLDGSTNATAVLIESTLANIYRQDLKNANKGNGEHGYSFVVPESLKNNQTHTIWGRVQGSTYILKWSPKTINCVGTGLPPTNAAPVAPAVSSLTAPVNVAYASTALPAFSDAESDPLSYSLTSLPSGLGFNAVTRVISGTPTQQGTFNLTYAATDGKHAPVSTTLTLTVNGTVVPPPVVTGNFEGYLSVVNCQELRGWIWDRNKPNTPLTVEFFAGSNAIGTVEAKNYRQDLKDAGKGNGEHGYIFQTPSGLRNNVNHQISAKVKNSNYTLKGSPIALQCASSARLSASSEASGLEVIIRGNPVTGDELAVEVRGAAGQSLRLQLNDLNGRLISERQLEQAQEVENHTLRLNHHTAGLVLLRISTPTRSKTIKVVKLN